MSDDTEPLLTLTVVGYEYREQWRQFIACMKLQTDPRWRCQLINDGPDPEARAIVEPLIANDYRFSWDESPERANCWGHNLRVIGLEATTTPYWGTQNADNYLMPAFVETILGAMVGEPYTVCIYPCVHNYPNVNGRPGPPWQVLLVSLRRNRCDAGTIVVRTELARKVGWRSLDANSDGDFVDDVRRSLPAPRIRQLEEILVVHN